LKKLNETYTNLKGFVYQVIKIDSPFSANATGWHVRTVQHTNYAIQQFLVILHLGDKVALVAKFSSYLNHN
jgi:hypothetical protein